MLLWMLMLVAMHSLLWVGFASYIFDQGIYPMFLALFVVGLGIGTMGMDAFHDWGRQKELNRIIEEYEGLLGEARMRFMKDE